MSTFTNRYEHPARIVLDRLPPEFRRAVLLGLRPHTAELLRRMRNDEGPMGCTSYLQRRCIYVHVPKTGGTSVKKLLCPGKSPSHTTLHYFSLLFTGPEFRSFFKFAFVRNPWDRLLSAYRFLKRGGRGPGDEGFRERYLTRYESFEDFVLNGLHEPEVIGYLHLVPQERFVVLGRRQIALDFLGYYESLAPDFEYVAGRLGLPTALPWENRSDDTGSDYRDAYTGPMIDKVAAVYCEDAELFGYGFDSLRPIALNRRQKA